MAQSRFGVISGLSQTFGSDSRLYDLEDTNSITFDAATLSKMSAQGKVMIDALNSFGSRELGSQLNMGTLKFNVEPSIRYMAPVMAYGISSRWTLAIGVPVIRYVNDVNLTVEGSNVAFFKSQFSGMSSELDAAFNMDLAAEMQGTLARKGYKPLTSRDESFVADAQASLLHKLKPLGKWQLLHQMTLHLPTGPKDDPDDLMALNKFGRTALESKLVGDRRLKSRLSLTSYGSIYLTLPDRVTRRVPLDESDSLPDAETKREVTRSIAPVFALGSDLNWRVTSAWSALIGTEGSVKGLDSYSGEGRVDLLARGSDSAAIKIRGGVSYSSLHAFKRKRASMPLNVNLGVSDTVSGRNSERQLTTELSALLFF